MSDTEQITARAVAQAAKAQTGEGSLRSSVELMRAYKRAYARVWRAEHAERNREIQREAGRRYYQRRRDLLAILQRELADVRAQLDAAVGRMALAAPMEVATA